MRRPSGPRSPAAQCAERGRDLGAQRRVRVALEQHGEEVLAGDLDPVPAPAAVHVAGADRALRQPLDERRQRGGRVRGDALTRVARAELAEHARDRRERRVLQHVGAVGRDDRVEHEPLDAVGVRGRVGERHLRAVGDGEDRQARVPGLLAQRLDVRDRVGGPEQPALRAELAGTSRAGLQERAARARRAERRARQRARLARPSLVHDEQVARGACRGEDLREGRGERRGRLAGAAREREDGAVARRRGRGDPTHVEGDGARDDPGPIQRDGYRPALQRGCVGLRTGGPPDGRVRCRGAREDDDQRGEQREHPCPHPWVTLAARYVPAPRLERWRTT